MPVAYINRDGTQITKAAWSELQADPAYRTVRLYDNGVVHVEVEWVGQVADFGAVWPDYYKVFKLSVHNYTQGSKLVPDPIEAEKYFNKQADAIKSYEQFLTKWTNSSANEVGIFQEADNTLAPPKPEDPNRPESAIMDGDFAEVGAW
jgi:hypothetical protein